MTCHSEGRTPCTSESRLLVRGHACNREDTEFLQGYYNFWRENKYRAWSFHNF